MIGKPRFVLFLLFKSQLFKAAFTIGASMVLTEDKCEPFFKYPDKNSGTVPVPECILYSGTN